eukprot:GHUV01008137.1.p1 GENE.GHUV01008137.1~~GHUV01008137.1.p1  ORF type:complete len:128 (+),score=33.97 GHUV01008137.1:1581-1964(+)
MTVCVMLTVQLQWVKTCLCPEGLRAVAPDLLPFLCHQLHLPHTFLRIIALMQSFVPGVAASKQRQQLWEQQDEDAPAQSIYCSPQHSEAGLEGTPYTLLLRQKQPAVHHMQPQNLAARPRVPVFTVM